MNGVRRPQLAGTIVPHSNRQPVYGSVSGRRIESRRDAFCMTVRNMFETPTDRRSDQNEGSVQHRTQSESITTICINFWCVTQRVCRPGANSSTEKAARFMQGTRNTIYSLFLVISSFIYQLLNEKGGPKRLFSMLTMIYRVPV
jgi:hypothetical protein